MDDEFVSWDYFYSDHFFYLYRVVIKTCIAKIADEEANPSQTAVTSASDVKNHAIPKITQLHAKTPYLNLSDPRWKDYGVKQKADPSWEWKTPIEFFGKVIDEKGQPVAQANIEISWSGIGNSRAEDGVEHRTLSSNADGLFEVTGIKGKGLLVRVQKEGYYSKPTWNNGWFEYAGFWEPTFIEPDRSNPVVFHLVKRLEAEPTYSIGERLLLQPPALETHIDLLKPSGQSTVPADLFVKFTRSSDSNYDKPFDWTVFIEGRNGAEIAETDAEFMQVAPENGYKQKIVRELKQVLRNERAKVRFYVRNKSRGLYAAVDLELAAYRRMADSEPASVIIDATVNPNNSPVVEYDPKKNIRKMENAGGK